MQQQSLLPFVLQGSTTMKSPPSEGNTDPPRLHKRTSAMGATYSVACDEMTASELEGHRRALTMTPLDTGFSGGSAVVSFNAYDIIDDRMHVPRFYGFDKWGPPVAIDISEGAALNKEIAFNGSLNPVQTSATFETLRQAQKVPHGALLVLPCGYGKTVCMTLWLAHQLGRRTLVLVHKAFLVSQWHERANAFLPGASVGKIQQNVAETDADIVVGMVHSIAKRDYELSEFGTIIVDEAHHMSAPFFSKALRKDNLKAKYILGLSATPERKDGLTPLLYHSMGHISHRIGEKAGTHAGIVHDIRKCKAKGDHLPRRARVHAADLNALAKDQTRNRFIAEHIARCMSVGRHVIVLTDRLLQLDCIKQFLLEKGVSEESIAYYVGSSTAGERERATNCPCILSTYSMAKEGLDIPRLDTLVMACPKGDVVQASGRVQRKHPTSTLR